MRRCGVMLAMAAALLAGAARAQPDAPLDYSDPAHWVCRPELAGACQDDLTATVLGPRSRSVERFKPAADPEADCFYLYPTVSLSPGFAAEPRATEAERRAVRQQVERLRAVCRLFAPVYRQGTVTAMKPGLARPTPEAMRAIGERAEADVLAAWDHYVAHDNGGRPVIVIGHSQGAHMAIRLVQARLDSAGARPRLVSVIAPGAFVLVPTGRQVGATFQTIPPCRSARQTGCVIAFNTVRREARLPAAMKPVFPGRSQVCANPAALAGGGGWLKPYLSTAGETIIPDFTAPQPPWLQSGAPIETPFVSLPRLYSAACRTDEHGAMLVVSTRRRPHDQRTGAMTGDWMAGGLAEPTMGLHLIDLNLVAGNLLDVLRQQIESLQAARPDKAQPPGA